MALGRIMGRGAGTRFWSLSMQAFRWVFEAAPREFAVTVIGQLIGAASLAMVLICGRSLALSLTEPPEPTSIDEVLPSVLCLAAALFVAGLANVAQREARIVIGELVIRRVQTDIIDVAAAVDYERFEEQSFNDLRDRATEEGANNALQLVYDLVALISSLTTSVSLLFVLATTVPGMLPLLVLVAAPFVVAARASARLAFRTTYALTADDRLRWSLFEALSGKEEAKEVRIFDLHRPLGQRWAGLFTDRTERIKRVALRRLIYNGLASVSASILVAVMLLVIVMAAIDGRIVVADAAIAVVALQQMAARLRTTANSAGSLQQSALFLEDFEEFRRQRPDPSGAGDVQPLPPFSTLAVEGLSFRYPGTDRTVLHDIDLEIGRGEVVALVGASGSGKTTLAHLIAGLYRPTGGRITWDGVDVETIDRARYWRSLTAIYQDYVRYQLTARENISVGDHRRGDELGRIMEAAQRASIHDVVAKLDDGYDSMLSRTFEGGVELSGGEWQRLAVARAFFRDAPMVILDEPAAALDAMAERELYEQLRALCVDRSALLISHRFSTVRMADVICVMHDGRIVERGPHEELVALDGLYASMFRVQAAGYLDG